MIPHYCFTGLKTKRIVYEEVFAALDSASLEQLKELSAKRRLIGEYVNNTSCTSEATAREMAGGLTCRIKQDIKKLDEYLALLQNFIIQVDSVSNRPRTGQWISDLKIRWTSILVSSPPLRLNGPKYIQINSLKYELGMCLFLYALTIREQAFKEDEGLKESASYLKTSAGVFKYLDTEVLPSLKDVNDSEKPPEMTTSLSSAMSLFCLAEAQAVTIRMAEGKKMSSSVIAKLHYGVTEFLDEASVFLSPISREVTSKFMDFINSFRNLHELESLRRLAESYNEKKQVGIAIGLLNRALNKNNIPRNQSWKEAYKTEVNEISELLRKYNRDNEFVYHEQIPLEFELPALEARKLVVVTPYEPEKWERQLAFK